MTKQKLHSRTTTKKLLSKLLLAFLISIFTGTAQNLTKKQTSSNNTNTSEICGTDFIREEILKQNTLIQEDYYKNIENIKKFISNKKLNRSSSSQYRIPVVIHVIHNGEPIGTGTNISDAQIQSQMNRLNSAFDNVGGGTNSVFTDITFCLAENSPNGSTVTWPGLSGVNRIQNAQTNTGLSSASQGNLMSVINWPSNQYLNIWLVSTINGSATGVIGYSPQPLTSGPLDGIVIQSNVFGDNTGGGTYNLLSGYDLGMTLVHEAGHYLGLYHTFQGASCTEVDCTVDGDMICDTPPTKSGSTCSTPICSGAQIENYMDYTFDSCKNTYTLGQKDWMEATINTLRSNLVSPENLTLTGVPCASPGLLASFTQSQSQICTSNTIDFTATTDNNTATTFSWTFPGGTPSTATGVGPHTITYGTAGDFDVILETNDGTNNLINTSVNAVYVTDCGTGISGAQAQWYFQQNNAVDFTSGTPVGITGSLNTRTESAASVSDTNGNLVFYTDGYRAWNSSGSISSTLRTLDPFNESPAQGAVIIPDPNNSDNYYVFSNPGVESSLSEGIRYSLYEGATQSFPTTINQAPVTNYTVTEHLAAAPHCNGTDYWVIYHGAEAGVNDKFLAYKVSTSGVSNTPVVSDAFLVPEVYEGGNDWIGQIDIAPNGRLMAATNINSTSLFIYEINRTNGQITLLAATPYTGGYGVSFSPNSEFLYVAQGTELRQYKIDDLLACEAPVSFKTLTTTNTSGFTSLQIGPDGKIYVNRKFEPWLDVINYPNEEITTANPNAIGYNDYGVFLPSSSSLGSRTSLPNMIDVPLGLTNADFDFCITNCGEVQFHNLSCGNQFSWDFGDTNTSTLENPSHTYTTPGTYTVTFTTTTPLASGGNDVSTATKTITINTPVTPTINGPQSVDCPTPVNQFAQYSPSPLDPNLEYYWSITTGAGTLVGPNPTDVAYIDWAGSGSLELIAIDPISGCKAQTKIAVKCITLSDDSFEGANFKIHPNPTNKGFVNIETRLDDTIHVEVFDILGKQVISKKLNTNKLDISSLDSGLYILKLSQNNDLTTVKLVIE